VVVFFKLIRDQTREKNIVKAKSEFMRVAAHELRTPITAVSWAFESLRDGLNNNPELKQIVESGSTAAERASKIVNSLLDVINIEEGQFGYALQEINLNEFIQGVIAQMKPLKEGYRVSLVFNAPPITYLIQGDPQRLGLVVSTLIDNAIRYNTKSGVVTISLEPVKGRPFVSVRIEDTGIGIPPQDLPKIFTKFYRGSNVQTIEPNGAGLALYIAKKIIERHGGEIGALSTLGRGSEFWFTLPLNPKLVPPKEIPHYEEEL
jgi:signal transduction histidine kinase